MTFPLAEVPLYLGQLKFLMVSRKKDVQNVSS